MESCWREDPSSRPVFSRLCRLLASPGLRVAASDVRTGAAASPVATTAVGARAETRRPRTTEMIAAAYAGASGDHDSAQCQYCLDAPRTVRLRPCGHACLCGQCYDLIVAAGSGCPICRAPVAGCLIGQFQSTFPSE